MGPRMERAAGTRRCEDARLGASEKVLIASPFQNRLLVFMQIPSVTRNFYVSSFRPRCVRS